MVGRGEEVRRWEVGNNLMEGRCCGCVRGCRQVAGDKGLCHSERIWGVAGATGSRRHSTTDFISSRQNHFAFNALQYTISTPKSEVP